MLNDSNLYKLIWIPMMLVAISTSLLGSLWMLVPEPWLLDQAANEILLQTTYASLFDATINAHLPDYLTGLYRFFGLWIFLIGFLMSIYILVNRLDQPKARMGMYMFLVVVIVGLYYFQFKFIATSHFIWTTHGMLLALVVSVLASWQVGAKKKID